MIVIFVKIHGFYYAIFVLVSSLTLVFFASETISDHFGSLWVNFV